MKRLLTFVTLIATTMLIYGQIDKEQLALDVSKADEANTEALKEFIWKRYSTTTVNGEEKAKLITEFKFNEEGEVVATIVGGESNVQQKGGVRGRIQENAIEENMKYVSDALKLSMAYTYMSKGQLLDFFEKASVVEDNGVITASAPDVYIKEDSLTITIDSKTKLYISKVFLSSMGNDPVSGQIQYETFQSGVNHGSETTLNLPARNAVIVAKNKEYTKPVE